MRVLREFGSQYDLEVATSLEDGLSILENGQRLPDVIVTDLTLADAQGTDTLDALLEVAPTVPIIVSAGLLTQALRCQLDMIGASRRQGKDENYDRLAALLEQACASLDKQIGRGRVCCDVEEAARVAAEEAVPKAMDHLCKRLGLHDEEGVRMAVKLARGWEAAKGRFISAIATGIASALLLALGAGIAAMLRNQGTK
ncbi:MAG: response regulator [Geminicoccaceae bacterium]|nr:response regulator [Geminicoccaceae bacterium]